MGCKNLRDIPPGHCFQRIGVKSLDGNEDKTIFLVLSGYRYVNTTTWKLIDRDRFDQSQAVTDLGSIQDVIITAHEDPES